MATSNATGSVVDAQVHAWAPDSDAFSWQIDFGDEEFNRRYREHFSEDIYTWERVIEEMDGAGVDQVIIVNPTMYADISYALTAAEACPGRFAIVHPITERTEDVEGTISELSRHRPVVGIRLAAYDDAAFEALRTGAHAAAAIRAATNQRLVVSLYTPGYTHALANLVDRFPDAQFVIDHLGLRQPPMLLPLRPETPFAGLEEILALARFPNVAIKASSVPSLSLTGFPYPDVREPLERTIQAFGVERVLWGSDFTRVVSMLSYRQGLAYILEWEELSPDDRASLLGGSARAVYGIAPRQGDV